MDGSSEMSFRASYARLTRSLSYEDQARLGVAENIIRAAATPAEVLAISRDEEDLVPLETLHKQLDGKNFEEILEAARRTPVSVNLGL